MSELTKYSSEKVGILLSNLGTPDGPTPEPVKRYLAQFLMDPSVVDIPAVARWLLVHGIILQTRPKKSAEAYQKIWTERGSPLLFHTLDLADRVREQVSDGILVEVGMRYGNPSIEAAVDRLISAGVRKIIFIPLYPQYSLAATFSSVEEFKRVMALKNKEISFTVIEDFWSDEGFLNAFVAVGKPLLADHSVDHVLFSFHGIPERHVRKTDLSKGKHCLEKPGCCETLVEANSKCYRAQSFHTAYRLAEKLGLNREQYSVSFQSRLGRTPWIQPYTDIVLDELVEKGVKRLAVYCPSFVADCLETLEEIQMRGLEQFREKGGEHLVLIPSLNSSQEWTQAVRGMISRSL